MGRQDFVDIPDSSKVVALDFGSAEFKAQCAPPWPRLGAAAAVLCARPTVRRR